MLIARRYPYYTWRLSLSFSGIVLMFSTPVTFEDIFPCQHCHEDHCEPPMLLKALFEWFIGKYQYTSII